MGMGMGMGKDNTGMSRILRNAAMIISLFTAMRKINMAIWSTMAAAREGWPIIGIGMVQIIETSRDR